MSEKFVKVCWRCGRMGTGQFMEASFNDRTGGREWECSSDRACRQRAKAAAGSRLVAALENLAQAVDGFVADPQMPSRYRVVDAAAEAVAAYRRQSAITRSAGVGAPAAAVGMESRR